MLLPSKLSSKWFSTKSNLGDAVVRLTRHHPAQPCSPQLCRGDTALVHSVIANSALQLAAAPGINA